MLGDLGLDLPGIFELFDSCDHRQLARDQLEAAGIIALHNAGYTMSDGLDDVGEVYERRKAKGLASRGYCFYHGQDVERAIVGGGLFLAFGDMRDEPEAAPAEHAHDEEVLLHHRPVLEPEEVEQFGVLLRALESLPVPLPHAVRHHPGVDALVVRGCTVEGKLLQYNS